MKIVKEADDRYVIHDCRPTRLWNTFVVPTEPESFWPDFEKMHDCEVMEITKKAPPYFLFPDGTGYWFVTDLTVIFKTAEDAVLFKMRAS